MGKGLLFLLAKVELDKLILDFLYIPCYNAKLTKSNHK